MYYLVHSHRRADGNTGNTRHARMRLVPTPERDDGLLQNRGYRRKTVAEKKKCCEVKKAEKKDCKDCGIKAAAKK